MANEELLPTFPTLRSPDMNGGVVVSTYKPTLRTETEGNLVAVRKRATLSRKRFALKWSAMTESDKRKLETFFNANQGNAFYFTNPSNNSTHIVVFAEDQIDFSSAKYDGSVGEMRYSVSFSLEECGQSSINDDNEPYIIAMEVTIDEASTSVSFDYAGKGRVDWGDGDDVENLTEKSTDYTVSHTYSSAGTYTLTLYADNITHAAFNSLVYTAIKKFHPSSKMTSASGMFMESGITEIPNFFVHPSSIASASYEFYDCRYLTTIGTSFVNVDATTNAQAQFGNCENLVSIGNFANGANAINCKGQFKGCENLVAMGSFANSPKAISLQSQFEGCTSLKALDFNSVIPFFKGDVDLLYMFQGCAALEGTVPPERTFENPNILTFSLCFDGCVSLENYYQIPPEWGGPQEDDITLDFYDANTGSLVGVDGTATISIGSYSQTRNVVNGTATFVDVPRVDDYGIFIDIDGYTLAQDTFNRYHSNIYLYTEVASNTIKYQVTVSAGSLTYAMILMTYGSGSPCVIDWGDGNTESDTTQTAHTKSHAYSSAGTYTVSVTNAKRIKLDGQSSTPSSTTTYGAMVTKILAADLSFLDSLSGTFENLVNLASVPPTFVLPSGIANLSYAFYHTPLNELPDTLWPYAYTVPSINISHAFEQASERTDMTGTIPADRLWNNTSVTWTATDCFKNCDSLDNYNEIPSVWGGGN